ncbi:MAG: hypothetical protein V1809_08305 [Planctomycetota bacterium]
MKPLWLALLGAGFLLAAPAAGDTIVLKKKGELKGTIIEEDDEKVTITLSFGTTTVKRSEIKEIRRGDDSAEAPAQTPETGGKKSPPATPKDTPPGETDPGSSGDKRDSRNQTDSFTTYSMETLDQIPDREAFEKLLLRGASENGLLEKPDVLRYALARVWTRQVDSLSQQWTQEMNKALDDGAPAEKPDVNNTSDCQAWLKTLVDGRWRYNDKSEPPASDRNITECWVKRETYKNVASGAGAGPSPGMITYSYTTIRATIWWKYSWDPEQNQWVRLTLAMKRAIDKDYEKARQADVDKARAETRSGPISHQMDSAKSYGLRAVEYDKKLTEGKITGEKEKKEAEWRVYGDTASAYERLIEAHAGELKSRLTEYHLKNRKKWQE